MSLTPAQNRVLVFIRRFVRERGYPPTRQEIAAGVGFRSPNAAEEHVKKLARKGYLKSEPAIARGIVLL